MFDLISFSIIARIVLSWVSIGGMKNQQSGKIFMILHDVTEPILAPFRKIIPQIGMIDISPLIAILLLDFVKLMILSIIFYLGSVL